jgi:hypothetical protein
MMVQSMLLFVMCVLDDEPDIIFSALRTANFTALGLHVATIAKIVQSEFSYYHSAVAVQIIFLTNIPIRCAVGRSGWKQLGRTTLAFCLFNSLTLVGECIYLLVSLPQARALAESCSPQKFIQFDHDYWMLEGWFYPVTIILAEMAVFIFGFADESDGWMAHLAVPFGIASIAFQAVIVGYFKPYMDGTEEQWGFGQIFAMAALAVPLYQLYSFARVYALRQPTHEFVPLQYGGYIGEHSPRQPNQPTVRILLWKDKCIFPLDRAKFTSFNWLFFEKHCALGIYSSVVLWVHDKTICPLAL